jgi:hypothetical protein
MIVNYLMYLTDLMDLQIIKSKYRRARLRKSPARLAGLTGLAGKGGGGLAFECLRQASFTEGASARTVFMPVDILFFANARRGRNAGDDPMLRVKDREYLLGRDAGLGGGLEFGREHGRCGARQKSKKVLIYFFNLKNVYLNAHKN